jgi:phosphohistidine phosphatase
VPKVKTLYLLRHAKAERDSPSGEDFDRPLDDRGRRDSEAMGRFLAKRDWTPAIIVYSPAARTQQTMELLVGSWRKPPRMRAEQPLYLAEPDRIASCVQGLADSLESAMIVGHNPGLEALAGALAERGAKTARNTLEDGLPTCALAVIELDIEHWSELSPKSARITGLYVAKDL